MRIIRMGRENLQREVPRKTTSTTTQPQGSAGHPLLVYRIAF